MRLYSLRLTSGARKTLRALEAKDQRRIAVALELLRRHPLPPKATKLRDRPGYRVRVGDFRVLYTIEHETITVVVFAIGHRRDVYR